MLLFFFLTSFLFILPWYSFQKVIHLSNPREPSFVAVAFWQLVQLYLFYMEVKILFCLHFTTLMTNQISYVFLLLMQVSIVFHYNNCVNWVNHYIIIYIFKYLYYKTETCPIHKQKQYKDISLLGILIILLINQIKYINGIMAQVKICGIYNNKGI
jgi:hypothetical protein